MARGRRSALSPAEHKLLEQACARNQSAEIHYHEGAELRTARTRLLGTVGNELFIDRPQCIGQDVVLPENKLLTVYLVIESELYAFRARVVRSRVEVDLNRQRRVPGVALGMPSAVRKQQRREQFRLSLARTDVPASLHGTSPDAVDVVPLDAPRFKGRIVNISLGGLGVLYDTSACPPLTSGMTLFVQFTLPEIELGFVFPVEARHVRHVRDEADRIVGLRFLDTTVPAIQVQIQQLNKFIVDEQRRQLRHIRRGGPPR